MVIGTTYIAQQKLECAGWWKVEVALLGWAVRYWLVWEAEYYENISD